MLRAIHIFVFFTLTVILTTTFASFSAQAASDPAKKYPTGGAILDVRSVPDVNGNGWADIIAGSADGNVYVIDGFTMGKIWNQYTGSSVVCVNHMEDISGDARHEVIVGCNSGLIVIFDGATGATIWSSSTDTGMIYKVQVIPDISGDGVSELLAGGENLGSHWTGLYCLNGFNGSFIWSKKYSHTYAQHADFVGMPDISGDGKYDVAWADGYHWKELSLWNGASGALIREDAVCWGDETTLLKLTPDITGDGISDLLLATYYASTTDRSFVNLIAGQSNAVVWSVNYTNTLAWDVTWIPDISSDGRPENLIGIGDRVECRDGVSKDLLWEFQLPIGNSQHTHSNRIVFDGLDLVVGSERGIVYDVYPENGSIVNYRHYITSGAVNCLCFISDVTGDGIHDILIGDENKIIYCLDYAPMPSDINPPEIGAPSQDPSRENVCEWQNVTISVNVTDAESGVECVNLSYSITGGITWETVTMTGENNVYNGTILGQLKDTVVKYKITAWDNVGNYKEKEMPYFNYIIIPEFAVILFLPLFMLTTLLVVIVYKRKHHQNERCDSG